VAEYPSSWTDQALIHLFLFYFNLLNPPWNVTYWILRLFFSDHIMDGKKIDFMILVIFWRKQPVVSPSLPLLCLHSRMVGHGRSMTRTSSLVRLCLTSLARASMNPSRVKSMVGDSRSCISQGMISMLTITRNSYLVYHTWHGWWDVCHRIKGGNYHSSKQSPTSMKSMNTIHL